MKASRVNYSPASGDLLIIHPGALGDVVAIFGIVAELKKKFRRLTMACRPSVGYLATSLDLADQHIPHDAGYWASLYSPNPVDRAIQLLNRHQQVVLFSVSPDFEDVINGHLATPCLRVPPRPPSHLADHVTRFAAQALVDEGLLDKIPSPRAAVCRPSGRPATGPAGSKNRPILLHPGAGSRRKRWSLAGFLEVASQILSQGGRPELIIGPSEIDVLETPLQAGLTVNVLEEMADLLRLLQSADGFIGNDSGVAHLAAYLGLPTTVIFTASDARRWRPNGPAVATLSPAVSCQPCFEIQTENCPQPECRTAVSPDMVMQSFRQLSRKQDRR